ncbi:hypothetical protein F4810DRAFT_46515 [Camillea tinctor]|nr:hypothetical protein F4810DRAFT_46515 [Camillea tinctor]
MFFVIGIQVMLVATLDWAYGIYSSHAVLHASDSLTESLCAQLASFFARVSQVLKKGILYAIISFNGIQEAKSCKRKFYWIFSCYPRIPI